MAAKNDITGDSIRSKGLSQQGRDNWDKIFNKNKNKEAQQFDEEKTTQAVHEKGFRR